MSTVNLSLTASLTSQTEQTRTSKKTPNFLKRFCVGIGVGFLPIELPFKFSAIIIAQRFGIISNLKCKGFIPSLKVDDKVPSFETKIGEIISVMSSGPICEELLFRGVIQDILLKRIAKKILMNVAPEKAWVLDTRVATAARIVFASALFSTAHLINDGQLAHEYVVHQAIGAFFGSLLLGAIKESGLGLAGAIGAHIGHNAFALFSDWILQR